MAVVTAVAIGFAYDAGTGNRELGAVFATCYVIGCIAAVLLVRPPGVFTAVIQPPLVLFISVPAIYFLFGSDKIHGLKDLAITCGYPLIERFPLMFFTSAAVLVIGLVRHYLLPPILQQHPRPDSESPSHQARAPRQRGAETAVSGIAGLLSAKLTKLTTGRTPQSTRTTASRRRPRDVEAAAEALGRSRPATSARRAEPRQRPEPPRRPSRPADPAFAEPPVARPTHSRRPPRPAENLDTAPPPRRPRPAPERDMPRRTPPADRRDHGRPRPEYRPEPSDRPMRRHRYAEDAPEPRQPRTANGQPGSGARHPVSRVRYRGSDDTGRTERADRPRERQPRNRDADSWEFDI